MGPAFGDGVVAPARVADPVGGDACNLLIGRDLAKQLRQHVPVAYVADGDLNRTDLQCLFIDPNVDLAPDAALGAAMLAGVPLPFTLDLDASAVDQEMQRALRPAMRMLTARVFWRRLRVLKSGTSQSRPISRNWLSMTPVVCRSAMPNSRFIVRQVWTAASLYTGCRPRLPVGFAAPPCQDRTRLPAIRGAWAPCYTRASSRSCRSVCSVCSCPPAITLESQD